MYDLFMFFMGYTYCIKLLKEPRHLFIHFSFENLFLVSFFGAYQVDKSWWDHIYCCFYPIEKKKVAPWYH